jgi:hypothetical protein
MLCDVDLIKVFRKRKVVIIVFEMLLWWRFPVSEFSVELNGPFHFFLQFSSKQRFRLKTNTCMFQVDIRSRDEKRLRSDQIIN